MEELLRFFMENGGFIDRIGLPERFSSVILDACRDDLVRSFCETESYQITVRGRAETLCVLE